jgi:hypothetical protein
MPIADAARAAESRHPGQVLTKRKKVRFPLLSKITALAHFALSKSNI